MSENSRVGRKTPNNTEEVYIAPFQPFGLKITITYYWMACKTVFQNYDYVFIVTFFFCNIIMFTCDLFKYMYMYVNKD